MKKPLTNHKLLICIELLTKARSYLILPNNDPMRTRGVCVAISMAADENWGKLGSLHRNELGECTCYLISWIKKQINGAVYLRNWLVDELGIEVNFASKTSIAKYQQTRVNWVNWMIAELQKEIK